jgi:hypothetical protein
MKRYRIEVLADAKSINAEHYCDGYATSRADGKVTVSFWKEQPGNSRGATIAEYTIAANHTYVITLLG